MYRVMAADKPDFSKAKLNRSCGAEFWSGSKGHYEYTD
jgi:hypothetical protein